LNLNIQARGPQFVYVTSYEGAIAAPGSSNRKIDLGVVPSVIFTNPSWFDRRTGEAKGFEIKTSVLPLEVFRGLWFVVRSLK
jgi:hypothetical protein